MFPMFLRWPLLPLNTQKCIMLYYLCSIAQKSGHKDYLYDNTCRARVMKHVK